MRMVLRRRGKPRAGSMAASEFRLHRRAHGLRGARGELRARATPALQLGGEGGLAKGDEYRVLVERAENFFAVGGRQAWRSHRSIMPRDHP